MSTQHNISRIGRIVDQLLIRRYFLRSILHYAIARGDGYIDRSLWISTAPDLFVLQVFHALRGRCGRYISESRSIVPPRVSFFRSNIDAPSQRLHPPLQGRRGRLSRCRVRIYLPDDVRDAPVVICSELPNNLGGSITNSAEVMAAGVIQVNEVPAPLVWIEHWPKESREGEESFELVVFSSYEAVERAPYLGEGRTWIGDAIWKAPDRTSVELLVGGKV
jgi:hypothetical protein